MQLRQELTSLEVERKKHIHQFIARSETELEEVWQKCYAGEKTKRDFNKTKEEKSETGDEDMVLNHYEANIKKWRKFYDENQLIISKVNIACWANFSPQIAVFLV